MDGGPVGGYGCPEGVEEGEEEGGGEGEEEGGEGGGEALLGDGAVGVEDAWKEWLSVVDWWGREERGRTEEETFPDFEQVEGCEWVGGGEVGLE